MSGETGGGLTAEQRAFLLDSPHEGGLPALPGESERDRLARAAGLLLADANARLAAVEAIHVRLDNPTHGCCAPPKLCKGHGPVCNAPEHGLNRPPWPCPTVAALHLDQSPPGALHETEDT